MGKFIVGALALTLCAQALAADPAPDATTETATEPVAEELDCTTLEGDAKTECEAKKAAAEPEAPEQPAAEEPAKGGKAKRSTAGHLQGEITDE
ncbi:MAG: hypothetical protein ACI8PZ_000837 [Myxococcota bacterium]|jgi:hypothetical protein